MTIEKSNAGILCRNKIVVGVLNTTFPIEDVIELATDLS
jgi:hypothetical protein